MSGAPAVGKTTIIRNLRLEIDNPLVSFVDMDDVKELRKAFYSDLEKKLSEFGYDLGVLANKSKSILNKSFFELSIDGYLEQSKEVCLSIPGMIDGALERGRTGLILAGSHIIPSQFDANKYPDLDITEVLLKISDEQEHWRRLSKRTSDHDRRTYMQSGLKEKFRQIRDFQRYLFTVAEKQNILAVESDVNATNKILKAMEIDKKQIHKGKEIEL